MPPNYYFTKTIYPLYTLIGDIMNSFHTKITKRFLIIVLLTCFIIFPSVWIYSTFQHQSFLLSNELFQTNVLIAVILLLFILPATLFLYWISFEKKPKKWSAFVLPIISVIISMSLFFYSTVLVRSSMVIAHDNIPETVSGELVKVETLDTTIFNPLAASKYLGNVENPQPSTVRFIVKLTLHNGEIYTITMTDSLSHTKLLEQFEKAINRDILISAMPNTNYVYTVMLAEQEKKVLFNWRNFSVN